MYLKNRFISDNISTPLLLPSFSSKGFVGVDKILESSELYIDTSFLISAYDLHYHYIKFPKNNTNLLFIDSGGYESSDFQDMSEINNYNIQYKEWDFEKYTNIINEITNTKQNTPMVVISYDNYKERFSLIEQIEKAKAQFKKYTGIIKEFLIKPEPNDDYINVNLIKSNITHLVDFDIIGVTEKELGCSVKERIINLYKLRKNFTEANFDRPIHIFGCLDTIAVPLYFLAGADIFDGLSWLRYAFYNDTTVYKSFAFLLEQQIDLNDLKIDIRNQVNNYRYLKKLQSNLGKYIITRDNSLLGQYGNQIINIYEKVIKEV